MVRGLHWQSVMASANRVRRQLEIQHGGPPSGGRRAASCPGAGRPACCLGFGASRCYRSGLVARVLVRCRWPSNWCIDSNVSPASKRWARPSGTAGALTGPVRCGGRGQAPACRSVPHSGDPGGLQRGRSGGASRQRGGRPGDTASIRPARSARRPPCGRSRLARRYSPADSHPVHAGRNTSLRTSARWSRCNTTSSRRPVAVPASGLASERAASSGVNTAVGGGWGRRSTRPSPPDCVPGAPGRLPSPETPAPSAGSDSDCSGCTGGHGHR